MAAKTNSKQKRAVPSPASPGSAITREEYARDRKSETRTELRAAMDALERGYWSKCLRHIAEAKRSAAKWEHAENVWRDWPNAEVSDTGRAETPTISGESTNAPGVRLH